MELRWRRKWWRLLIDLTGNKRAEIRSDVPRSPEREKERDRERRRKERILVYSEFSSWKVNHLRIVQRPTLRAGGHFLEWLTKRFVTADGHSFSTLSGLRGRSSGVKYSPPHTGIS